MNTRSFPLGVVSLLLAGSGLHAGIKNCNFPNRHSVVLTGAEGNELAYQCSRTGVPGVRSIWIPNSEQISELQIALCNHLRTSYPQIYRRLKNTYFQFVGYNLSDRQIIYVNAFPDAAFIDSTVKSKDIWKIKAICAYDGGISFWGIEYNLATKSFVNMAFNGGG